LPVLQPEPRPADRRRRPAHAGRRSRRRRGPRLLALVALAAGLGSAGLGASGPAALAATTGAGLPHGLVAGAVTAIGDSVMVDYAADLEADVPHCTVYASVGRQWYSGIDLVEQLRSEDRLGATVVIGLGTNGPVTTADFDAMMSALAGAKRIVFVTIHVDQPWESEVNTTLVRGARAHRGVVLAAWGSLAQQHPGWLYPDRTHLPIGGVGAQALARLVAHAVTGAPTTTPR
jgi:hypothetical protein